MVPARSWRAGGGSARLPRAARRFTGRRGHGMVASYPAVSLHSTCPSRGRGRGIDMETRIAVAAQGFGATFQGRIFEELRRAVKPGQSVAECEIVRWDDGEHVRACLLGLLQGEPRPAALIGICMRPDAATLAAFAAASVPVVLVDERAEGASTVASDSVTGGYLAGQHLVRAGRRAIALVSGPIRDYNAMQRLRGVAKALSESGVPLPTENVLEAQAYSYEDGAAA